MPIKWRVRKKIFFWLKCAYEWWSNLLKWRCLSVFCFFFNINWKLNLHFNSYIAVVLVAMCICLWFLFSVYVCVCGLWLQFKLCTDLREQLQWIVNQTDIVGFCAMLIHFSFIHVQRFNLNCIIYDTILWYKQPWEIQMRCRPTEIWTHRLKSSPCVSVSLSLSLCVCVGERVYAAKWWCVLL